MLDYGEYWILSLLYTLVKLAKSHHFFLLSFVRLLYIVFVCLNCLFVFSIICYHMWWIKMFIRKSVLQKKLESMGYPTTVKTACSWVQLSSLSHSQAWQKATKIADFTHLMPLEGVTLACIIKKIGHALSIGMNFYDFEWLYALYRKSLFRSYTV